MSERLKRPGKDEGTGGEAFKLLSLLYRQHQIELALADGSEEELWLRRIRASCPDRVSSLQNGFPSDSDYCRYYDPGDQRPPNCELPCPRVEEAIGSVDAKAKG